MAHSNGHGDFVLLELGGGTPWEIHKCYTTRLVGLDTSAEVGQPALTQAKKIIAPYACAEFPPVNIQELEIRGIVTNISDRVIPLRLMDVHPSLRQNAFQLLGCRKTEIAVTTTDEKQYRICADPKNIKFGRGSSVRILVDRFRIRGMGIVFLCKEVSLVTN